MKNRYYEFRTMEEMEIIESALWHDGYEPVLGKRATFEEVKATFKRNKVFVIMAFYNSINKKYEYQYSTWQIVKSYPAWNK